jgi:hypothetical protein
MSLLETLIHPNILLALFVFAILSLLVELVGLRLLEAVHDAPPTVWIFQHLVIPAARATALVAFILVAYPALFGLNSAMPMGELLSQDKMRLTNLYNVTFVLSLLLPLIPLFSRLPALLLPIQGIIAASMVFHWLAATQPQVEASIWPGFNIFGIVIVLAIITHAVAKELSHILAQRLDAAIERQGSDKLIYRTVVMALQAPVILVYTLALGEQVTL